MFYFGLLQYFSSGNSHRVRHVCHQALLHTPSFWLIFEPPYKRAVLKERSITSFHSKHFIAFQRLWCTRSYSTVHCTALRNHPLNCDLKMGNSIVFIHTEGALRSSMTYENHPFPSHPIPLLEVLWLMITIPSRSKMLKNGTKWLWKN